MTKLYLVSIDKISIIYTRALPSFYSCTPLTEGTVIQEVRAGGEGLRSVEGSELNLLFIS